MIEIASNDGTSPFALCERFSASEQKVAHAHISAGDAPDEQLEQGGDGQVGLADANRPMKKQPKFQAASGPGLQGSQRGNLVRRLRPEAIELAGSKGNGDSGGCKALCASCQKMRAPDRRVVSWIPANAFGAPRFRAPHHGSPKDGAAPWAFGSSDRELRCEVVRPAMFGEPFFKIAHELFPFKKSLLRLRLFLKKKATLSRPSDSFAFFFEQF